jgi:hypothetical protein
VCHQDPSAPQRDLRCEIGENIVFHAVCRYESSDSIVIQQEV